MNQIFYTTTKSKYCNKSDNEISMFIAKQKRLLNAVFLPEVIYGELFF